MPRPPPQAHRDSPDHNDTHDTRESWNQLDEFTDNHSRMDHLEEIVRQRHELAQIFRQRTDSATWNYNSPVSREGAWRVQEGLDFMTAEEHRHQRRSALRLFRGDDGVEIGYFENNHNIPPYYIGRQFDPVVDEEDIDADERRLDPFAFGTRWNPLFGRPAAHDQGEDANAVDTRSPRYASTDGGGDEESMSLPPVVSISVHGSEYEEGDRRSMFSGSEDGNEGGDTTTGENGVDEGNKEGTQFASPTSLFNGIPLQSEPLVIANDGPALIFPTVHVEEGDFLRAFRRYVQEWRARRAEAELEAADVTGQGREDEMEDDERGS